MKGKWIKIGIWKWRILCRACFMVVNGFNVGFPLLLRWIEIEEMVVECDIMKFCIIKYPYDNTAFISRVVINISLSAKSYQFVLFQPYTWEIFYFMDWIIIANLLSLNPVVIYLDLASHVITPKWLSKFSLLVYSAYSAHLVVLIILWTSVLLTHDIKDFVLRIRNLLVYNFTKLTRVLQWYR